MAKAQKKAAPRTKAARSDKAVPVDKTLRIKFDACGFVSLAVHEEPPVSTDLLSAKFDIKREAEVDTVKSMIIVTLEASLYSGEDSERKTYLEAKYKSHFLVTGMQHVKEDKEGNKQFPAEFARSLFGLTYSSMRGALAEKTARTWLEKQILPVYRANALFFIEDESVNATGNYPV